MKKRLVSIMLASTMALTTMSLVACNSGETSDEGESKTLKILAYDGGYGTEWLDTFAEDFIATKPGYTYTINTTSEAAYTSIISTSKGCPDLIIANGLMATDISNGFIEPVSDVYSTLAQSGITVKEEVKGQFTRAGRFGGKEEQWAMPWTAIPLSIAVNEKLLKEVVHTTTGETGNCVQDGKWVSVPTTIAEFATCLADITAQKVTESDPAAFGWSKEGALWFESMIYTWWAQKTGIDTFYDFWNFSVDSTDGPESYRQEGIKFAFQTLKDLFTKDGKFINNYGDLVSLDMRDCQREFAKGKMVFCLTGDFFANEYKEELSSSGNVNNIKFMQVPAVDADAYENENYTYITSTSAMFVPAKGANKQIAKDFLVYISQKEQLVSFTDMTGGIRPYEINGETIDVRKELSNKEWTPFQETMLSLYYDCDDVLSSYPRNADEVSLIYLYEGVNHLTGDYAGIMERLKTMSVDKVIADESYAESLYYIAKQSWKNYSDYNLN